MRNLLFLIVLLSVNPAIAKTQQAPELNAHFSAIIVEDMERSLAWYQKVLGLSVINQIDMMQQRGFHQANLKNKGLQLELIQTNKTFGAKTLLADKPKKSKVAGFFKLGFVVEDFDRWLAWFTKHQVKLYGSVVNDPVSDKRTVLFLDPDGNRLQLFEL